MHVLNWVDLIIILLIIGAIARGLRISFWRQLFMIVGFFVGLFGFGWISSHSLRFIHDPTDYAVINGNIVLIVSSFLAIVGASLGHRVHIYFHQDKRHYFEHGLSVILSVSSVLVAVWLISALLGRLPFEGLSNSVNDAFIIQFLDYELPPAPSTFAVLGKFVSANNSPQVFVGSAGDPLPLLPTSLQDFTQASNIAEESIVRVTSFGCGGIVSGSGFVVAPELVVTNAHVIAGVHRPIIKYLNSSHDAIPVYFDAQLDLAILRVKGLKAPTLNLTNEDVSANTTVAVLGYPSGKYTASPGLITSKIVAYGRTIYDIGLVGRDIYSVQMDIQPGSSGGPIVLANGQVAGVVFSKVDSIDHYGYALTSKSINNDVKQAMNASRRVGTGVCSVD